jgi:DNA (cytosine-5)-methyltransferase 1
MGGGMATRPVVVDLFCGAGGMSLGFEAAGFDVGLGAELDPIHCATHEFNFPYGASICADLSTVSSATIEARLADKGFSQVDVLVGGPPCQGFSQIGKRQLDDPRNMLVFEYLRLVAELRPKYFVFENVKGIVLGKQKMFVDELIEEFKRIGYRIMVPYRILNAADYGVAQNRHRFILIGVRKDQADISYPEPAFGDTPHGAFNLLVQPYVGSKDVLEDLENIPVFTDVDYGIHADAMRYSLGSRRFSYQPSLDFNLCHRRTMQHTAVYGHLGSKHTKESQQRFAATAWGKTEPKSRFYKLDPASPSNTLRAGTDSGRGAFTAPRPIHYAQPRCITIREGARLHSFPDWFQFNLTIWHGFRQIGNAVAPLFAKRLADQIAAQLGVPNDSTVRLLPQQDESLIRMSMSEACKYYAVPFDTIGKRLSREEAIA